MTQTVGTDPRVVGDAATLPPTLRASVTTPTKLWNDSADPDELSRSIEYGAVGATCNPVIALTAIKRRLDIWGPRLREMAAANATLSEDQIGWLAVEELSIAAAKQLEPSFVEYAGRNGRVSIQTDPRLHRNPDGLVSHAVHLAGLAPNVIVKIPATNAGITAIEEATYRGVSINATVSFSVSQAIAVGAAVERGLGRREADGEDTSSMGPVCTIMVGRLDDWLKVEANKEHVLIDPGYFEWAGVAVLKRAYEIYRERGYRTRMLSAAFRNHLHWSEFVGGDLVISPPFDWQMRINENPFDAAPRIDVLVAEDVVKTLHARLADFRRAYDVDGMTQAEFDGFPPTRRTLRQFLAANNELEALVRDVVVPSPD